MANLRPAKDFFAALAAKFKDVLGPNLVINRQKLMSFG
jgi:hypothetical protein